MTKPKNKPGDYILLYWDGHPDEEYIHGHVTVEEFARVVSKEQYFPSVLAPTFPVTHAYGLYVFNGQFDYGNPMRTLKVYDEPGRGRFKLTVAKEPDLKAAIIPGSYERTMAELAEIRQLRKEVRKAWEAGQYEALN